MESFTGERHRRDGALAGPVNRVVPADRLMPEASAFAIDHREIPVGRRGKRVFYEQPDHGLVDAYRVATAAMVDCVGSEDGKEGIAAFTEKRKPLWKNR